MDYQKLNKDRNAMETVTQSKLLKPGYKFQVLVTMADTSTHRIDVATLKASGLGSLEYLISIGAISEHARAYSRALEPVPMSNEELLAAIRHELTKGIEGVELVKSLVALLEPRSLPGDMFDAIARAYTVAGGREYAKEDVSHGDSGVLYAKVEVPTNSFMPDGVHRNTNGVDRGPINVRE
jgi:hypothetical protein